LKPKTRPAIKRAGKINHPKNIIRPAKIMKISTKSPANMKILLITAPKAREIILKVKASKYLFKSKLLP
jgi:hypothetical protein